MASHNPNKTSLPSVTSRIELGSSLQSMSINQIAQTGGGYRACAIEIRNYHRDLELTDPSTYVPYGQCTIPPAPAIKPGHSEACLFHSTGGALVGTFGLLTYGLDFVTVDYLRCEILNRRSEGVRLALLWNVPMAGSTLHAVGIAPGAHATSDLYQKMRTGTGDWFFREPASSSLKFQTKAYNIPINVEACISDVNRAVWIVNIQ